MNRRDRKSLSKERIMKFSRLSALWLFWPAVTVVVWGELMPDVDIPHVWDKLLHFTAYFGLAGLASVALGSGRRALWAALGLVLLGGMLEIVQGMTGRDMSFYDEVANMLGVAAGALAAWGYLMLLRQRLVERQAAD